MTTITSVLPGLLFFLYFLIAKSHADNIGAATPPPPPPPPLSTVSPPEGSVEFPESVYCNQFDSKCFGQIISCLSQCPTFKPYDPKNKGCFADCNSKKCEAICRTRRPNCNGIGAACYDPRFVGGDGVMFYFHGKTNEHFSLVSDSNLQINARFIGRRPSGRSRDNTWIQALGLMFDSHSFTLAANKVAQWDDQVDQLLFTYDGTPFNIPQVTLRNVVEISVKIVPITKEDDRIHKYEIPSDDCFAHLEVQFKFFNLSEKVEGVLGKTYRPDFENPVKRGVPMPIMGGENKYKTSSLVSADCNLCIFSPSSKPQHAAQLMALNTDSTLECTSNTGNGHGSVVFCRW
ncbi:hypothetical protein D5086_023926 [Populus alba]|uniref:Uncharacterized protein n=3 Tax=Populus TaxID=3689 RepID=A0ACC4BB70_POPAL|nr:hypothetical protein NC653_030010 [Populus alba x Populus x berolinensis]TKS04413.1 uncharacterized protein D5086_0000141380 [Populus alba]